MSPGRNPGSVTSGADPAAGAAALAAPGRQRYGGFWARSAALGLDLLWLTPLVLGLGAILFGKEFITGEFTADHRWADMLFSDGVVWVAMTACWLRWQATPGKILLRLRIVDAETLGKPSLRQFLIRSLLYAIAMVHQVGVVIMVLGCFWVAIDKRHQGWHDKLARTLVIRVDD